jgi:hypothetical protein
MPVEYNNWADMMEEAVKSSLEVKNETGASWNFNNVYSMDEMLNINEQVHFSDSNRLGSTETIYENDRC